MQKLIMLSVNLKHIFNYEVKIIFAFEIIIEINEVIFSNTYIYRIACVLHCACHEMLAWECMSSRAEINSSLTAFKNNW